jgi:hypothetical protein
MTNKPADNEIVQMENQYWQGIKDKDVATCERLTDFPCLVAGAHGIASVPKEKFRKMMESDTYTLNSFEIKESEVRMLTDDIALHAYKAHQNMTLEGKPLTLDTSQSSTWIRRDGRWACALHTESIIGDPYGRDRKKAA